MIILDRSPEFADYIHQLSIREVKQALRSTTSFCCNPEYVLISITIIAMELYNGELWAHVHKVYKLDNKQEKTKYQNCIVNILERFDKERKVRLFTTMQSVVPKHFLTKFFEFAEYIFKDVFSYSIPDDQKEQLTHIYTYLNLKSNNQEQENIDIKDKTYQLIKGTRKLFVNDRWYGLNALIKFTMDVINIIDDIYYNNMKNIAIIFLILYMISKLSILNLKIEDSLKGIILVGGNLYSNIVQTWFI